MAIPTRKPDYRIGVKLRENPEHGSNQLRRAGSAWIGEKGAISITLDPGVVLDWRLSQEAHIMLFPVDDGPA